MWLYEPERLCRDGFRRTIEFSRAARATIVACEDDGIEFASKFLRGATTKFLLSIRDREVDFSSSDFSIIF